MQFFQYIITILFVDGIYTECGLKKAPSKIARLNLANNDLLTIKRQTFNIYRNLEELTVINSKLASIEDGAFHDLLHLKEVNLSNNFIAGLNVKAFRPRNRLWKLVVSHNMLSSIDGFDVSYFPELTLLDVSNNRIRSLPQSLADKLRQDANFTLMVADNPLDCENGNWSRLLNEELYAKFCRIEELPRPQSQLRIPTQATFVTCLLWNVGAFWCGIIVGNVCLIKRIVCPPEKLTKVDETTQCDHHWVADDIVWTECKLQNKPASSNVLYV